MTPKQIRTADPLILAQQALAKIGPTLSTVIPDDVARALVAQGMDFNPTLGPGRPLDPYYGVDRQPRLDNYVPGQNIASEPGNYRRIPFQTIANVVDNYDLAQTCLVPGTLIFTRRGVVPVEDVKVGDEVLTHKGRWRAVTETMANPVGGKAVYEIRARGLDALTATGNHPIFAARYKHN